MIWVIGGTRVSVQLAEALCRTGWKVVISTATSMGRRMIENPQIQVENRRMELPEMMQWILQNQIRAVTDASHPFAVQVSENAIAAAGKCGIPYFRLERVENAYPDAVRFDDYGQLTNYLEDVPGNILLTIGMKNLSLFNRLDRKRLFVKILPTQQALNEALECGIPMDQIIALKGILSRELWLSIFREYGIQIIVAKDSGPEGGTEVKYLAAMESNCSFLLLSRPYVTYPSVFYSIEKLIRCLTIDGL